MVQFPQIFTGSLFLVMQLTSNIHASNLSISRLNHTTSVQSNVFRAKRYHRFKQNYLSGHNKGNNTYVPNFYYEILKTNKTETPKHTRNTPSFIPSLENETVPIESRFRRRRNRHRHSKRVKILRPTDYLLPPRNNDFPELTLSELEPLYEAYRHYKRLLEEQGKDPGSALGIDETDFNNRFKTMKSETLYRIIKDKNMEPENILKPPIITIRTTDYMFFVTPATTLSNQNNESETSFVTEYPETKPTDFITNPVNVDDYRTNQPIDNIFYNFSTIYDTYQTTMESTTVQTYLPINYDNYTTNYEGVPEQRRNTYLPIMNYTENPLELASDINSLATDYTVNYFTTPRTTEISEMENYELTRLITPLLSPEVEKAGMKVQILNHERNTTEDWFDWNKDTSNMIIYDMNNENNNAVYEENQNRSEDGLKHEKEKEFKLLSEETTHYRRSMLSKKPLILLDTGTSVIPGEAGEDYPTLNRPPINSRFTCKSDGRRYVADVSSGCQVFYMCVGDGPGEAMLCPNGTLFSQDFLVCDWWYNVECRE